MTVNLETVAAVWTNATPDRKAAALKALRGDAPADASEGAARVLKWGAAAARLGITRKRLRDAVKQAGIRPVVLPGSTRAFGVRLADLVTIAGT